MEKYDTLKILIRLLLCTPNLKIGAFPNLDFLKVIL